MEVTKHLIGAPGADETDNVRVNFCEEQGVGSGSTKASCRDVRFKEAKFVAKEADRITESRRDETGSDFVCFVVVVATSERGSGRCP